MTLPRLTDDLGAAYRSRGWWRDRLLDSFIDEQARARPRAVAAAEAARRIDYATLSRSVDRFARRLVASGVRPRDVVSFQLPNWIEALVVHHGILRAGAVSNPIIPIYREHELRHILSEARSRVVVTPSRFRSHDFAGMYEGLRREIPTLEEVWVVEPDGMASVEALATAAHGDVALPERAADDPALLLYTSGTTAAPKGVVHTHNTLDYENRTIIDLYGLTADDVVFMPSPVTHITGVLYGLLLPSMLGTHVVLQDVWDPTTALDLVRREGCTFTVAATPFLAGMVDEAARAGATTPLRVFACGGADVAPELVRDADRQLGCATLRVYGSTEYPTLSASAADDAAEKRAATDGRLIADAEARILTDDGREAGPGEVGELWVRGPEMFLGYLAGDDPFDAGGWFATGDLASADADGYLQIRGRKKDIILRGGENISVREVEDLLYEHPDVREVAVVAVRDRVLTERACAVVVPRPGAELTLDDLVTFLTGRQVARQKCPEYLRVVDELPKTASGKVQKFLLRERYATIGETGEALPTRP